MLSRSLLPLFTPLTKRIFHLRPPVPTALTLRYVSFNPESAGICLLRAPQQIPARLGLHQAPYAAARAIASDARTGGSTKHRSAISHANSSGDFRADGDSKLIYRSPLTLIKIFRSLALVQTAGCIIGCCSMFWLVRSPAHRRAGHADTPSLPQHNPFSGSGDLRPLALGLSVGFFGIVAARTIGTLVKRHVNTVRWHLCPLR